MSIEAMKQALEVLDCIYSQLHAIITAITEAEEQERKCDNCGEFGLCCQQPPLEACVKEFFKYLNHVEESDSGKMFHPITINCSRVLMLEPLNDLLDRMAELSGAENRIQKHFGVE